MRDGINGLFAAVIGCLVIWAPAQAQQVEFEDEDTAIVLERTVDFVKQARSEAQDIKEELQELIADCREISLCVEVNGFASIRKASLGQKGGNFAQIEYAAFLMLDTKIDPDRHLELTAVIWKNLKELARLFSNFNTSLDELESSEEISDIKKRNNGLLGQVGALVAQAQMIYSKVELQAAYDEHGLRRAEDVLDE